MAIVTLDCDNLQNLCPGDNSQRTCTCVVTSGTVLRWQTNRTGVFSAPGSSLFASDPVGTTDTEMGFTVTLTNNNAGQLTSTMTFTPTDVTTTSPLRVICSNPIVPGASNITILSVTYTGM